MTGSNEATDIKVVAKTSEPTPTLSDFIRNLEFSDDQVRNQIDRMPISADTKAMLYQFSKATVTAGRAIIKIGRKLIDIIFALLRQFPNLSFGVIFGLLMSALITAIPVIGAVLGSLFAPILFGLGVAIGSWEDFKSGAMGARIDLVLREFEPLNN